VKTRWDSTTQMCIRARILQRAIYNFLIEQNLDELRLTEQEWQHVHYLISLTAPFNIFTQTIGRSSSPSIQDVYEIYNVMFHHIETSLHRLRRKTEPWKVEMKECLQKAHDKLSEYYSRTSTDEDLDYFYAFSWLLNPSAKNNAFTNDQWRSGSSGTGTLYRTKYMRKLREKWVTKYKEVDSSRQQEVNKPMSGIDLVKSLHTRKHKGSKSTGSTQKEQDELARYFNTCMSSFCFIFRYILTIN
jgi:hypothetical protein